MQTMQSTPVETLFFIPDISGFTKFVTETEICHSQHIVKELLEALVDANTLELKVAEFEGDAVLFYRHGSLPPLEAIVEQARRMFVEFHGLLQRIEYLRVCRCGACTGASRLGLKVVAHHGAASTMAVKDHVKFIGRDVIVAHRLLKNSVPEAEYLLLTQATLARLGLADADTGTGFAPGADAYDDLGKISYRYRSLAGYLADVRFDPPPPSGLKDPVKMMRISRRIDASAERIYELLIDLPARMQWIDGIKSIEFRDDRPNQIGKVHRCVREGNDPEVVTSDARIGEQALEFWETDTKRLGACKYSLTKAADGATDVVLEFFVRRNLILQLVFKALMQRKLKAGFERSLANLARLCTAG